MQKPCENALVNQRDHSEINEIPMKKPRGRKRKIKMVEEGSKTPIPFSVKKRYPQSRCTNHLECRQIYNLLKAENKLDHFANDYRSKTPFENHTQLFHTFHSRATESNRARSLKKWSSNRDGEFRKIPNGKITVRPNFAPSYSRDVCPHMYAFLIQRNYRFVKNRIHDVWKNILMSSKPEKKTRNVVESAWKLHLKFTLLKLPLEVLHWCGVSGNIRLQLEKTKELDTLEKFYWSWLVQYNRALTVWVTYNKNFEEWWKSDRDPSKRPMEPQVEIFPKFSSFKHYWYTKLNIKYGTRIKSLCDDCQQLKSLILEHENNGNVLEVEKYKNLLKYHLQRKDKKKQNSFRHRINANECWQIDSKQKFTRLDHHISSDEESDVELFE